VTVGRAAAMVVASRLSGSRLGELPEDVRPHSVLEGYVVQNAAHALLEEAGLGQQGGWKVGCTSAAMQAYLGIDSPAAGAMFRSNMWHGHHRFTVAPLRAMGAECEIAVRMGSDLPAGAGPYSVGDVGAAVAAVMAAIEVVEDRYVDFHTIGTPTLVADDFFHHGCVLGEQLQTVDPGTLSELTATMTVNGSVVGGGRGSDLLGDPLLVLAWLANNRVSCGTPLRAGDIVLLGSLVAPRWIGPGDDVEVHNDGLGRVTASFAEGSTFPGERNR
jgi:2-keto-4-pentenoate hydratase